MYINLLHRMVSDADQRFSEFCVISLSECESTENHNHF